MNWGGGKIYTIHPYNDGSKDDSLKVIQAKADEYPGKVIAHTKPNGGHGPTILQGYREMSEAGYTWVFQIDSDDEMGPEGFPELWNARENYDFLVGIRDGRKQALPRKIISAISRMSVRLFYGKSIWDVNTPYRLMRVSAFKEIWDTIPSNTFAPNVIISGMAGFKKLRCYESRVPQRDRQTGEVSIKKWKLFKAAVKSFWQTIIFSITNANFFYPVSFLLSTIFFALMINYTPIAIKLPRSTDGDVFYTIGRSLCNGILPYRDIFDHKGPLIYFINALGYILGGFRGVGMIEILFWISFLYVIEKIRKILKIDCLISNIIVVSLPLLVKPLLAGGNLVEEYALPFIAYGNLYLSKLCLNRNVVLKDNFILGICATATFCLRPNMISVFLIDGIALLFFFIIQKRWLFLFKSIFTGLIGILLVSLPILIIYFLSNSIQDMYFCVWKFNMLYSKSDISLNSYFIRIIARVCSDNHFLLPILVSFIMMIYYKYNIKFYILNIFSLLNVLLSTYTCVFARSMYDHYILVMIPIYVVLIGIIFSEVKFYKILNKFPLIFCCIVFMNFPNLFGNLQKQISLINESVEFIEIANFITKDNSFSENKILILGNNCNIYTKLNLNPKFKYIYQDPIINFSDVIKDSFFQSLAKQEYDYIIDPIRDDIFCMDNISNHVIQELYKTLTNYYNPILSNNEFIIYKRKNDIH